MLLSIIIPCYNEQQRLRSEAFAAFANLHEEVCILFVNDGSSDSTLPLLHRLAAQCPNVEVLALPRNVGKAEAVRQGVLHLLRTQPSLSAVAFYDADMAAPLADLLMMADLQASKGYFMVAATRIRRLGGNVERRFVRFFLGRMFATAVATILHMPVYDTQCGAKVIRADVAAVIFAAPFVSRWLFDIELFARIAIAYGHRAAVLNIYEFPLSEWRDIRGSKLGWREILRQPISLFKVYWHYKKQIQRS
ncbi:MAG: glycosyltransferase [Prevotellaceae bacterium]|jgi:glycosyltransferase involved in cell wall biosynthesis|nr:glycosyltransferase [Prevotellaceae bacterium]